MNAYRGKSRNERKCSRDVLHSIVAGAIVVLIAVGLLLLAIEQMPDPGERPTHIDHMKERGIGQ